MSITNTVLLATLAVSSSALAIDKRATCSSYTIIDTRGTGEAQGPSAGFLTMNSNVQAKLSGGKVYNTVYAASFDQQSSAATQDIIDHIQTTLASNPSECFILEGYSQGAAATVNALSQITGSAFTAVKGVFLIGDPEHTAGLTCNVDNYGGTTTRDVNGLEVFEGSIPSNWISKTLDVCIFGDGVCDTTHGVGIDAQHLQYPYDAPTQNLGTQFIETQLAS
ncbi:putative cutinase 1 [Acrodontium crateriforme]|uniref:Cutinase 1 n=1 Tax=Acrodontium crateriforme TaxID=150365 RepID=A0AAQ3MD97_9PEZI|nr:putative cutinase 1 [Acrodontium crateriforme]